MQTSQQLMTEYGNEREMMRGALMKIARATTMVSAAQPLAINTFRGVQPGSGPVSASVRPVTNRGGLTVASDAHATARPDSYAPVNSSELIPSKPAGSVAGPKTIQSPASPGAVQRAAPSVSVREPSSGSGAPTLARQSPYMNPDSMAMPAARDRARAFQHARNNGIDVEKYISLGEVQRANSSKPPMSGEASVIGKVVNAPASAPSTAASSRSPAPASSYGAPAPSWDPRSVRDPVSRAPTSAVPSTVGDPALQRAPIMGQQPDLRPAAGHLAPARDEYPAQSPKPVAPTINDPGQLAPTAVPVGQVRPVDDATVQRFMGGAQPKPMAAGPLDPGNKPYVPGQPQQNQTGRVGQAAPASKPGQVTPAAGAAGPVGQVGAPPSSGPATTVSGPPSGVLAPASTAQPSAGQLNPAVQQAAALGNIPVASAEQQANAKAMGQAQALKNIPAQHQEAVKNIANDQTKTPEQKTSLLQDTLGLSPGAAAALLVLLAGGYVTGKGMEMTGRIIGGAAAGFGGGHGGPAFYGSGMAAVPY